MLWQKDAVATIAVKDIAAARRFYEGTLGLTPAPGDMSNVVSYTSGKSSVLVYVSQFAGTNQATAATWMVGDDIEKVVQDLKAKGVAFEHYANMPGVKLEGDIHIIGKIKNAWLKDPDGNILSIVNG